MLKSNQMKQIKRSDFMRALAQMLQLYAREHRAMDRPQMREYSRAAAAPRSLTLYDLMKSIPQEGPQRIVPE